MGGASHLETSSLCAHLHDLVLQRLGVLLGCRQVQARLGQCVAQRVGLQLELARLHAGRQAGGQARTHTAVGLRPRRGCPIRCRIQPAHRARPGARRRRLRPRAMAITQHNWSRGMAPPLVVLRAAGLLVAWQREGGREEAHLCLQCAGLLVERGVVRRDRGLLRLDGRHVGDLLAGQRLQAPQLCHLHTAHARTHARTHAQWQQRPALCRSSGLAAEASGRPTRGALRAACGGPVSR